MNVSNLTSQIIENPDQAKSSQIADNPGQKTNKDYYASMATVVEVRPISVTENVKWNLMSKAAKFLWVIGTLINMLALTMLSLRVDRLCDRKYISNHWKHYSGEKLKSYVHT